MAAICTGLQRAADDSILEDLREIAVDQEHGARRGMAIVGLGSACRYRDRALEVLLELLRDDEVVLFALLSSSVSTRGRTRYATSST